MSVISVGELHTGAPHSWWDMIFYIQTQLPLLSPIFHTCFHQKFPIFTSKQTEETLAFQSKKYTAWRRTELYTQTHWSPGLLVTEIPVDSFPGKTTVFPFCHGSAPLWLLSLVFVPHIFTRSCNVLSTCSLARLCACMLAYINTNEFTLYFS